MEKRVFNGQSYTVGYHTQEFRPSSQPLSDPIICSAKSAWLGIGYYFWVDEEFAHYWGSDSKMSHSGYYDVYEGLLNTDKVLNAVFDERGYYFFKQSLEKAVSRLKTNSKTITLERVNRFLSENVWGELGVEGIMYDDLPANPRDKPERLYSEIYTDDTKRYHFFYKKRIQIVLFSLSNVVNFSLYLEEQQ